jgi:hypothetical protein
VISYHSTVKFRPHDLSDHWDDFVSWETNHRLETPEEILQGTRSRPEGDSRSDADKVRQHRINRAPRRARGTDSRLVGVSVRSRLCI